MAILYVMSLMCHTGKGDDLVIALVDVLCLNVYNLAYA